MEVVLTTLITNYYIGHCLNHCFWCYNAIVQTITSFSVVFFLLMLKSESSCGTGTDLGSPSVSWSRCSLSSINWDGPPPPSPNPNSNAPWFTLPLSLLFLTVFTSCQQRKPPMILFIIHRLNTQWDCGTITLTSFTFPLISYESPGGKWVKTLAPFRPSQKNVLCWRK